MVGHVFLEHMSFKLARVMRVHVKGGHALL